MDIPVTTKTDNLFSRFRLPIIIGGLLIVAYLSMIFLKPAVPGVKESDVWLSEVRKGEFTRKVRGVGTLVPSEIRWIAAASPGRIERLLIKPGAWVTPETVIAELSNPELLSQLAQARWELDAAEANFLALKAQLQEQTLEHELRVTQARMALETAKLKEQAEKSLADKNIISALDFATTKLDTQQRKTELEIRLKAQQRANEVELARLTAEQANVRRFKNMVDHFETQMKALHITADIDGVLQEISVDVGQRVDVGSNVARVAKPDTLLAELQVQENQVKDLQTGYPVIVDTRNGFIDGVVKRIDPRVLNGNVQVDVELIGAMPEGVRPDLSVTGTIVVEQIADALYIDRPAGTVASSTTQLFTMDDDQNLARLTDIQFGKASISSIQILAGLQPGDSVIVSDMSDFNQHSAIRVLR